ncbi:MAG: hypothetical protein P8017_16605, partial [Deltaproteobacteria bacterium]
RSGANDMKEDKPYLFRTVASQRYFANLGRFKQIWLYGQLLLDRIALTNRASSTGVQGEGIGECRLREVTRPKAQSVRILVVVV